MAMFNSYVNVYQRVILQSWFFNNFRGSCQDRVGRRSSSKYWCPAGSMLVWGQPPFASICSRCWKNKMVAFHVVSSCLISNGNMWKQSINPISPPIFPRGFQDSEMSAWIHDHVHAFSHVLGQSYMDTLILTSLLVSVGLSTLTS